MSYREGYEQWLNDEFFDETTRKELEAINDEKEIEDRFYRDLEFGTGGLRGVMGAGTNRMNKYTVFGLFQMMCGASSLLNCSKITISTNLWYSACTVRLLL